MRKKSVAVVAGCVLVCLLAVLCVGGLAACNRVEDGRPFGVWWWSDELGTEYLDFAKDNGVTEIYYCTDKFNERTDAFVEKANAKGMKVYWLSGKREWVNDFGACKAQVDRYLAYQAKYAHRFEGIHFDIEPHQYPEFKNDAGKREELLTKFVGLAYSLKESYPNVWIEYDLPFWFDDEIEGNGVTKAVYKHFIDLASRITIMSYRDKAEKIFSSAKDEIEYAKSVRKTLILGVNTKESSEGNTTFAEEGKNVMYEEIAKLKEMIPSNFGIAIHQIKYWYDLKS